MGLITQRCCDAAGANHMVMESGGCWRWEMPMFVARRKPACVSAGGSAGQRNRERNRASERRRIRMYSTSEIMDGHHGCCRRRERGQRPGPARAGQSRPEHRARPRSKSIYWMPRSNSLPKRAQSQLQCAHMTPHSICCLATLLVAMTSWRIICPNSVIPRPARLAMAGLSFSRRLRRDDYNSTTRLDSLQ